MALHNFTVELQRVGGGSIRQSGNFKHDRTERAPLQNLILRGLVIFSTFSIAQWCFANSLFERLSENSI